LMSDKLSLDLISAYLWDILRKLNGTTSTISLKIR
jgi:hypothetical protein